MMKLLGYMSNGYPSLEESIKRAELYVYNGVDIIEADFPARDPYLDSPYLINRIEVALSKENDYGSYMESVLEFQRRKPEAEVIVNIYEETVREIGVSRFVEFMKETKTKDILLVGNEYDSLRADLEKEGFEVSSFVTRAMTEKEFELASRSNGFVYLQGFGPEEDYSKEYPTLKECVAKVRDIIGTERKIYCGVGIQTDDLLREVNNSGADGAFLGSIVLRLEDDNKDVKDYIKNLRKIADEE